MSTAAQVNILPDYLSEAKRIREDRTPLDVDPFKGAFLATTCPGCDHDVSAFVVDGPDPVFVDLVCPRPSCSHEFTEAIT
ncbi:MULTISPECIES: hypothetical protein [unclassified Microbacterium]|uniref:hypothetical protein n=1 Tax=unclassified Microbacterium TaxID=2609290 RepID=UPI001604EA49|nr:MULTISPECIES: hypothetical protein [unclassified Microbacterium]QNA93225.1 hypothetical protein G4G29_14560 [Microbacterium sp. Se63.02b]QYM63433.1 hypothetical protein K1X59_14610 [Microbacterium sp. Se5.02b]